jgi:soluble lytic murein transglycosylase-like protein
MGSADVAGVDLAALLAAHGYQDSVAWALTSTGISIAGAPAAGSGGQLVTVRTIWSKFGGSAVRWADSFRIPVELIVATIATESRGDPAALRLEPGYADDDKTPDKVSPGLMQTLISTARDVLRKEDIDRAWLLDADNSIQAGTACIDRQRRLTLLDPPKVACAYNAGGLYHDTSAANRWKMRQFPLGRSSHGDRFVQWFNDCIALFDESGAAPAMSFYRMLQEQAVA